MNNRSTKIFKFPRKEMQVSEEINKKKSAPSEQKTLQVPQEAKISKADSLEKANASLSKQKEEVQGRQDEIKNQKQRSLAQASSDHSTKTDNFMRMSEKGVLFEKKLTKIALPDQYEKLKFMSKIENKLLNCLEKKKPLIPMKKLVSLEMLNDILGKKQRKLVSERPHFIDNLDVEAHSLKKNEERSEKPIQKQPIPQEKIKVQENDHKLRLKLLPLRVPSFRESEDACFQEENSNFIFQQAEQEEFNFFQQEDSIFDCPNEHQNAVSINFSKNDRPRTNYFEERKSNFIEKQANRSIFSMEEYKFDENLFHSTKRQSPSLFPQNRPRPAEENCDILRIKVPPPRAQATRGSGNNENFNIFSIEEEPSNFFSAEKHQRQQGRRGNHPQQQQAENYWRNSQQSSQSSSTYY